MYTIETIIITENIGNFVYLNLFYCNFCVKCVLHIFCNFEISLNTISYLNVSMLTHTQQPYIAYIH